MFYVLEDIKILQCLINTNHYRDTAIMKNFIDNFGLKQFIFYLGVIFSIILIDEFYKLEGFLTILFLCCSVFLLNKFYGNKIALEEDLEIKNKRLKWIKVILFGLSILFFFTYLGFSSKFFVIENNLPVIDLYNFITLLKIIIIFPILEEVVFRKYLLRLLNLKFSTNKALIINCIGFTLCNIYFDVGLLYVFMCGMFYSHMYIKSKNILFSIILHAVNNSFSILFKYYIDLSYEVLIIITFLFFLLFVLLYLLETKRIR